MENQYQVGVTVNVALLPKDLRNAAVSLSTLADQIEKTAVTGKTAATEEKPAKAAKGKAAKNAEPEETFDLGESEEAETEEKTVTLDEVIKAFQAYAKRHSREKAGAALKKFGVKSVHDLKAEQYADVMEYIG